MDDDDYVPDPADDPATRGVRALADQRALLGAALKVAAVLVGGAGLAWLFGVSGARALCMGLFFGSLVAVVNLALLARGTWALFQGRVLEGVLCGGGSFTLLLVVAWALAVREPTWLLGYGLGITLPAFAGLVYARAAIVDDG